MKVSVVIPCYYSQNMISKVVNLTRAELIGAGLDYEFILVNDGSNDNTFQEISKLCDEDLKIIGIDLMQNFGQHNAIMAGLHQVSGDIIMLMDDDMQTHPSQCMSLINALDDEVDVVFASYNTHKEPLHRRLGSRFALWSARALGSCPHDIEDSSFLVMRRCIGDALCSYTNKSVYIQGLIFRTTKRIVNVKVEHFEREQGESGYSLRTLVRLWSTIFNFSVTPLRVVSFLGFTFAAVGIIWAIILAVQRILDPAMQMGWASIMVTILISSAAILLAMGILGEYISRIFEASNKNPQYLVRQKKN